MNDEQTMTRDPRYDVLFEPVKIGPLTARNRFYQVPHCSGMGYRYPNAEAHMRGIKAEGGWAVISTQEAEIHPTSELTPANEARLWDDGDIGALSLVADKIHAHGSLAAIQLVHNGLHAANRFSRMIPLAPSHVIGDGLDPVQARSMDKSDIADMRRWYRNAAIRAKQAGFDIIYIYSGHDMSVIQHFLSRRHNHRTDEYGGSFENRLRLFREILGDARDVVGDTCALAVRLAVDELLGPSGITCEGEGRDIIEALAEVPDLWDVNLSNWSNDSQTARFSEEGFQEPYIRFVKSVTTKPVVGVGRYTSPDSMARVIRQGIMDFIGAARPSIADPFLPVKIEEGRIDDIRECIGCKHLHVRRQHLGSDALYAKSDGGRGMAQGLASGKDRSFADRRCRTDRRRRACRTGSRACAGAAWSGRDPGRIRQGMGRPRQPRKQAAGTGDMGARARLAGRAVEDLPECADVSAKPSLSR